MEVGEIDIGEGVSMEKRNVSGGVKKVIDLGMIVEGGKIGGRKR